MAQPYLGEIRIFAGNFAPASWMFCEGQLLPISEHPPLFNLIGTMYGGDGQSTFALPDLRGRLPLHFGNGFTLAETGGVETVTLTTNQIPSHTHALLAAATNGNESSPVKNVLANSFNVTPYINDVANGNLSAAAVTTVGGTQPHNNFQPYLCVNFIICVDGGMYPSQS